MGTTSSDVAMVRQYLLDRSTGHTDTTSPAELWEHFYREQHAIVCRIAYRFGVSPAEAEDCVQQTWLELFKRLPALEPNGDPEWLRHWLCKVVRSKLTDHRRRKRRRLAVSLYSCADELLAYEIHYGRDLEQVEVRRRVRRALVILHRQVPLITYRVIRMRFVRGLSVPQVCHALGLSRQQVWDRQRYGLKKLACILRQLGCSTPASD